MKPKTRLHFKLQYLESSNLATHFDPANQPPIVIEKMGAVQTVGFSQTPRENFQAVSPERLALAVKLARRYCRGSYSGVTSSCMTNNHVDAPHHISPLSPPAEVAKANLGLQASKRSESCGKVRVKSSPLKGVQAPKKVAADDITCLKVKLQEQSVRLSTTARSMAMGGASRGGGVDCRGEGLGVPGGRGGVLGRGRREEDENEERCQRRRKEQWSRNSRMIYDLSQQVKDLEKKTYQKCQHHKKTGKQIQSEVVKKLAAAQRAALRTLQNFSGKVCSCQDSIPPELSLLVQQLALVSTYLGGGPGSSVISTSIHQLMDTIEERQRMTKLAQEKEALKSHFVQHTRNRPSAKAKWRNKNKKKGLTQPNSALHTGLLLSPQLQQRRRMARPKTKIMHFSQGTFNSIRRQQPPVVYTPLYSSSTKDVCSSPVYRGTSHLLASSPTPSDSHKEVKKKIPKKSLGLVQMNAKYPLHPAKLKKEQLWHEELEVSYHDGTKEEEDATIVDLPIQPPIYTDILGSAIAEQANQLKSLRQDISQKLTELKVGVSSLRQTAPVTLKHFPHLPDTTVSNMIQRLDELMAEEDEIRQRWTSIVYDDPLYKNPDPVLNKQKPPVDKPQVLPRLSTQRKIELDNYRQCYAHYLACTGQSTQEESSPWEMAERIADELLCEMVEGVAEEVGQLCDGYIEDVYGEEFLRPP